MSFSFVFRGGGWEVVGRGEAHPSRALAGAYRRDVAGGVLQLRVLLSRAGWPGARGRPSPRRFSLLTRSFCAALLCCSTLALPFLFPFWCSCLVRGVNAHLRRLGSPLRPQYAVGLVIAPIRLFLVAFTLCFGLSVGLTCLAGVSDASLQQRLKPRVRQLIYYLIRIFSRVILFIVGLYKIEEHRLADEAAELADLNGAPFLLVSNHVSFLDIPYHFARDAVAFVAKVEVRRLPIIGRIAAVAQCIFTSRAYVPPSLGGSPVEARSSPREVGRPAAASAGAEGGGIGSPTRARLSSDEGGEHMGGASAKIGSRLQQPGFPTILLFPEGTTSNNCALLRFRTGAFIHGAPVKPVVLQWYVLVATSWWG